MHGLDWCDITSALKADCAAAAKLAFKYSPNPICTGENELKAVQEKVSTFVKQGALGPFANAYWGHKTYHFTPEQNLIVLSHYLKLLEVFLSGWSVCPRLSIISFFNFKMFI